MIAQKNRTGYTGPAPEKDGAGFGDLLLCGGQPPSVRYFFVRMSPSMGGACGASSDAPIVPHNRFANPQALAHPVWRQERQGYKPYVRRHVMSNHSIATSVASFSFEKFTVRAINRNGEIWFVAADVCAAIDLGTEQIRRLDDDEKGLHLTQTPGGKQEMSIINESGLYALILRSRKPEAKRFRKWVTSEVLPAIRKTGAYIHAPAMRPALTTAQKRALKQKIWQMAPNWITQSGEQWIYNHLRVAFQVARFDDIPSDCFDAAMALLESKQKAISQYIELFYEMRTWFEREVLGASTPWTPHIRKLFFAKLGRQVILPPKVDWLALADEMKARKGGLK